MIAGVLLAAGGARRFGSQKLIALLDGEPVVRRAARTLARAVDSLIVVVGNERDAVCVAIDGVTATIVDNVHWARGMSTSLMRGISAVPADAECALVALGDQPGIDAEVARAVVTRWRDTRSPIVVARYADGRGHPVLFARELFGELLALEGDQGARALIERSADRVAVVDVAAAAPRDVDTVDDLRMMTRSGPAM